MKPFLWFSAVALAVIIPLTGLAYAIGGWAYATPVAVGLGATAGVFALLNRDLFQ
jgi:hypothetical protein